MHQIYLDWSNGIFNFVLPYQIGMSKSKKVLEKWKKEYENKIVYSIRDLFVPNKYKTYINQELYKLDKMIKHPRDLGDYDVIAIDQKNHVVWIVEVKYLRLNLTAQENINAQDEYFLSTKSKANKFLKRTNYFESHLDEILHNIGYSGHFKLRSFFVANKVIRSQFKKYPFKIVGFNEFKNIVNSK